MENKIDKKDDESLYQPKIHNERVRVIYNIKQVTGKPMTVLLDQAIRDLAASYNFEYPEEESIEKPIVVETWEEFCEYRAFLDRLNYLKCLIELENFKTNDR